MRRGFFAVSASRVEMSLLEGFCLLLVPALGAFEIAQQLAGIGILGVPDRLGIKPGSVLLHFAGLVAYGFQVEFSHQPDRLACVKAAHMLAPDRHDGGPEPRGVAVDQQAPVPVFLGGHAIENRRAGRIIFPQPLGIGSVDAAIFLLGRDGEGKDFSLGQGRKIAPGGAEGGQHGTTLDHIV